MTNDRSKKYLITGAPQCPYPDAKMGPDTAVRKGTALSSVAQEFDHLYIQYYNNFCYPSTLYFWPNFNHWKSLSEQAITTYGKGPKIFVGLPADIYAANGRLAGRIYFQSLQKVADLYKVCKINREIYW